MAIRKQDILRAALQLERDGRRFYLGVASRTASALARKMFESLADDELRHIEWLKQLSAPQKGPEAVNRELSQRLSHIFAQAPEALRRSAELAQGDIQAIRLGMEMEEKSQAAYAKWSEESDSQEMRTLCTTLAEVERYHKELLSNTLEYLEYSIDWFLQDKGVVELG